VSLTRAFLICTVAAGCLLESGPALAFCSKPIAPYCVGDGSLTDSYVPEARCRRALEDHVEDLTRYRDCLTAEVGQIDEAVERFRSLLSEGAEKSRSIPAGQAVPGGWTTAGAAS
jgi:hypothetical protein